MAFDIIDAHEGIQTVDPAQEPTLAAILAKLPSDPATQTTLTAVLAKLSSDPATQTTLAAILAKLPVGAATEATLAAVRSAIQALSDATSSYVTDGVNIYVRHELINATTGSATISYTTMAGVPASPTGTLTPYGGAGGGGGGAGDASAANQITLNGLVGPTNDSPPGTDTGTSSLNGLIKRNNQNISTLTGKLPGALDTSGGLKVAITGDNFGLATAAGQVTLNAQVGTPTDTPPSSDTGSGSVIGIGKRIAQRVSAVVTALGGGLPSALGTAGGLQVEVVGGALQAGPITETDHSGIITTGGTAQNAVGANSTRRWLVIHNPDAAENLWYRTTGAAVIGGAGSICVPPYGTIMIDLQVPSGAVSVIAATTGHKFTVVDG